MSFVNGSSRTVIYENIGDRYFNIALSPTYLYVTDWTERYSLLSHLCRLSVCLSVCLFARSLVTHFTSLIITAGGAGRVR